MGKLTQRRLPSTAFREKPGWKILLQADTGDRPLINHTHHRISKSQLRDQGKLKIGGAGVVGL
jgi:hypothetical protein